MAVTFATIKLDPHRGTNTISLRLHSDDAGPDAGVKMVGHNCVLIFVALKLLNLFILRISKRE